MPVVVAGLALAFLILSLFGGTELDRALLRLAEVRDAPGLHQAAEWLSWAAAPLSLFILVLVIAIVLAIRSRWREAVLLLALVLLGQLLVEGAQQLTQRLRPQVDPDLLTVAHSLYPSRHAANATITAFALAYLATRRHPARGLALFAAALFAFAVGLARLIVGGAWPSDVIGGWAFGLAWTLLFLLLARTDLGDGTARPLRHSSGKESDMSENPRTESARRNDDKDLIDNQEDAPAFNLTSGGDLERDVGSRAEITHETLGKPGTEGVRDSDKSEGDANLPRFNER